MLLIPSYIYVCFYRFISLIFLTILKFIALALKIISLIINNLQNTFI